MKENIHELKRKINWFDKIPRIKYKTIFYPNEGAPPDGFDQSLLLHPLIFCNFFIGKFYAWPWFCLLFYKCHRQSVGQGSQKKLINWSDNSTRP